eukprot:TRINITY_DN95168_c0_g1_i1.p1 TRINITY_DN95168_c0_g1~~TRINITY_DN95168_c0_g1_i1.p1  ORF type:complete len:420 (+),score=27.13 TRINITY_DN95168_c0_g1_i1:26-1285(+)
MRITSAFLPFLLVCSGFAEWSQPYNNARQTNQGGPPAGLSSMSSGKANLTAVWSSNVACDSTPVYHNNLIWMTRTEDQFNGVHGAVAAAHASNGSAYCVLRFPLPHGAGFGSRVPSPVTLAPDVGLGFIAFGTNLHAFDMNNCSKLHWNISLEFRTTVGPMTWDPATKTLLVVAPMGHVYRLDVRPSPPKILWKAKTRGGTYRSPAAVGAAVCERFVSTVTLDQFNLKAFVEVFSLATGKRSWNRTYTTNGDYPKGSQPVFTADCSMVLVALNLGGHALLTKNGSEAQGVYIATCPWAKGITLANFTSNHSQLVLSASFSGVQAHPFPSNTGKLKSWAISEKYSGTHTPVVSTAGEAAWCYSPVLILADGATGKVYFQGLEACNQVLFGPTKGHLLVCGRGTPTLYKVTEAKAAHATQN